MAARQTNNVWSCKLDGSGLVEVLQLSAATAVAIDPKGMFSTYFICKISPFWSFLLQTISDLKDKKKKVLM